MSVIRQITFTALRVSPLVIFAFCLARYSVLLIRIFDLDNSYGTAIQLVAMLVISAWQYAVGRIAGDEALKRNIHITAYEYFDALCLAAIALELTTLLLPSFVAFTDYAPMFGLFGLGNIGNLSTVLAGVSIFKAVLTAKALVSVEEGRSASFSDYLPTLLLIMIPFIGVWFIQSRINMMRRMA